MCIPSVVFPIDKYSYKWWVKDIENHKKEAIAKDTMGGSSWRNIICSEGPVTSWWCGEEQRNSNRVGILDWTKRTIKTVSSTIISGLVSLSKTTI